MHKPPEFKPGVARWVAPLTFSLLALSVMMSIASPLFPFWFARNQSCDWLPVRVSTSLSLKTV